MTKWMVVLLAGSITLMAGASVVVEDDFSTGQGSWATRSQAGNVVFTDGVVKINPNSSTGQPGAAYRGFDAVTLGDGQTLRLTVDVATTHTVAKDRDLRIALGFATTPITGNSTTLAVPLSGYGATIPAAGSTVDPRIYWVNAGAGTVNFFNTATATIGDPSLDNAVSASTALKTWVIEVKRSGSDLVFSGSLDGTAFGSTVTATGANVISGFQFNTLGLAYAYSTGQTATYDNMTLEVIPEPATLGLVAGVAFVSLALRRLFS